MGKVGDSALALRCQWAGGDGPVPDGVTGLVLSVIVPATCGWIAGTIAGRLLGDDGVDFFRLTREEQGAVYGIIFAGLAVLAGVGVLTGDSPLLGPEPQEEVHGGGEDPATPSIDALGNVTGPPPWCAVPAYVATRTDLTEAPAQRVDATSGQEGRARIHPRRRK